MTKFGVLTASSLFVSTILFNNSIPTPSIPCHSSFLCSENNVMSLISHLPSFDGTISSWIIKFTTSSIAYILFATYSNSISFGLVPLEWKTSYVLPIPKSSPASSSPFDYRPISLLSLASEFLENYNLLAV